MNKLLLVALVLCTAFLHTQCEAQATVTYTDTIPRPRSVYGNGTRLPSGTRIQEVSCRLVEMTLATPPPPAPPVERWHVTCLLTENG